MKKLIDRGKRSKALSNVKPVGNNLQNFLEVSPVQKEVLPLHELRDHAYEYYNPFGNLSHRKFLVSLHYTVLRQLFINCLFVCFFVLEQNMKFRKWQNIGIIYFRKKSVCLSQ